MVQGNALAVLSFDSAPFRPSDEEKEQGWTTVEKASVIPTLETIDQVPLADFTELMFFETQPDTLPEPLVNEHGFDPTVANWDAHIILRLRSINPKLWILDGDTISTICRDAGILQLLRSIRYRARLRLTYVFKRISRNRIPNEVQDSEAPHYHSRSNPIFAIHSPYDKHKHSSCALHKPWLRWLSCRTISQA